MDVKETIVQTGDPVLRQKTKALFKKDIGSRKLMSLVSRMKKLLAAEKNGVAIAAPQVGEPLRLFIVSGRVFAKPDFDEDEKKRKVLPDMVFINPELVRVSRKKVDMPEGCLSVRDVYGSVVRHEKATVRAWDEHGEQFVHHGSGLVAQIFQHELDHLEGILYTDKATKTTTELPR